MAYDAAARTTIAPMTPPTIGSTGRPGGGGTGGPGGEGVATVTPTVVAWVPDAEPFVPVTIML